MSPAQCPFPGDRSGGLLALCCPSSVCPLSSVGAPGAVALVQGRECPQPAQERLFPMFSLEQKVLAAHSEAEVSVLKVKALGFDTSCKGALLLLLLLFN